MEQLIKHANGQWTLEKSASGYTFEHVKHTHLPQTPKEGARPIGAMDHHEFKVMHNGKHIGSAQAIHESDNVEADHAEVAHPHKPEAVKDALDTHLATHHKKYMGMSPSYGK